MDEVKTVAALAAAEAEVTNAAGGEGEKSYAALQEIGKNNAEFEQKMSNIAEKSVMAKSFSSQKSIAVDNLDVLEQEGVNPLVEAKADVEQEGIWDHLPEAKKNSQVDAGNASPGSSSEVVLEAPPSAKGKGKGKAFG